MIHLGTIRFCKRFISYKDDTRGKTSGQMIGAARSGRQNIIEGSERAATSKETEIKLTDVARASLGELLGDYEIYLADKGVIPWSLQDPNRQQLGDLWLPDFEYTNDSLHDYGQYYHRVKVPFEYWLNHKDDTIVANAMIVLIQKTMSMPDKQLKHLGDAFVEEGGFRERMYHTRTAAREAKEETELSAPDCPQCEKKMRRLISRTGKNQGREFWGCSGYPECRGTRPIQNEPSQ